jgi:hypothetical protein
MTLGYDELLGLWDAADIAEKKAVEASKPWEAMAHQVAKETKGLEGHGEVRFEKTRFRIACAGTGIYAHETWWEDFPINLLIDRMREVSQAHRSDER